MTYFHKSDIKQTPVCILCDWLISNSTSKDDVEGCTSKDSLYARNTERGYKAAACNSLLHRGLFRLSGRLENGNGGEIKRAGAEEKAETKARGEYWEGKRKEKRPKEPLRRRECIHITGHARAKKDGLPWH